ncbi:MAG TPA: response regulator [Chryseosolibacter sp.]|nr:response regulator [Chryseosolibacter sp.]
MTYLYVEDDEDDIEIFRDALLVADNKALLYVARSVREAFRLLDEVTILPDYIFLDLNLPETPGIHFLKKIKQMATLKHVPVICYSTTRHLEEIEECKRSGAQTFITKPSNFTDLVVVLEDIVKSDK